MVEEIVVGAIGSLVVPAEDVGSGFDDGGADMDTGADIAPVIKRPERDEWVTFRREAAIRTSLVAIRSEGRDYRVNYAYVSPTIRKAVASEIKPFTVMPFFSWLHKRHYLAILSAADAGTSGWGDSIGVLLAKSPEWHASHAVRIRSNRDAGRYEIRCKPIPGTPVWPTEEVGALLGTALGAAWFVSDTDHPVYQRLLEGEEIR
jgi:hypothetical protein